MNHDDYERKRRALDEQLEAGFEILRAAHRAQVRALDLVWMSSAENPAPLPVSTGGGDFGVRLSAPVPPSSPPPAAATAAPPPRPPRLGGYALLDAIEALLPRLPALFDRSDLEPLLPLPPERSSLYRAFQDLVFRGVLEVDRAGEGRTPSRYRKRNPEGAT